MKQLRGIIMCGGQSKRMGTDKGLIPLQNSCWVAFMVDKLTAMNLPVSISINLSQLSDYSKFFPKEKFVLDVLEIAGPLNGLLSAHLKFPNDDLLLLACDMINMQAETLTRLVNSYASANGYDFYVYQNRTYAEPFCGIYTSKGLSEILLQSEKSALSGVSMQSILNLKSTKRLPITENGSFKNYNTPNEIVNDPLLPE